VKALLNLVKCDIAVIGAGAAGIAAAVAAAESGLNVILVEKNNFTGGIASSAMVGTICGLYYRSIGQPRYAVQGFARHFADGIMKKSNIQPIKYAEGLAFLPYHIQAFHQQAVEQLELARLQLFLQAQVFKVTVNAEIIIELTVHMMDKIVSIQPQAVIDCTGSAHISRLAGLEIIEQDQGQSSAFTFQVKGLPDMDPRLLALNMIRGVKRGIDSGKLEQDCERLSIIPGTVKQGGGLLKLGLSEAFNGEDLDIAGYEIMARARSTKIVKYLNKSDELFKNLTITMMATELGIRSGARPQGIDMLKEDHILACAKPSDGVAIGSWPIEYWGKQRKPEMTYFDLDDYYLIPAGTLVSKHLRNLFFAGKGISSTERAIASARVIGTCFGTGYASGMLAAESVQEESWQSAIGKIRNKQLFTEKG